MHMKGMFYMIKNLTLKEKIGQMLMVGIDGDTLDTRIKSLIMNYKIGGVILYRKNFKSYEDMLKMISELKELNLYNKIPLFIGIDQEGGRVNRMPSEFHNILSAYKLANTKNINIVREAGDITGTMLYESGININFSPVLDVLGPNTSQAIGNRCFGDNAKDVSKYGIQMMQQLQKHKVLPVIKHFPGQGAVKVDSHYMLPRIKQINENDIEPFKEAIKRGADAIMVGHLVVKSSSRIFPASLSKKMIDDIRHKYDFKGIIMTDDLKMRAIRYLYGTKRALKRAFLAGNDIALFRFKKSEEEKAIKAVIKLVEKGRIKEGRIDRSVARIIEMKEKYGISDKMEVRGCNIDEINSRIDSINACVEG